MDDLRVVEVTDSSAVLAWTAVDDGTGDPAKYEMRWGEPGFDWGPAYPDRAEAVAAEPIGTEVRWVLSGLEPSTAYGARGVTYRGTLNESAEFGGVSNGVEWETADTTPEVPPDILCRYDPVATGGGPYLVMVGDSLVSEHRTERRAQSRAAVEETRNPADSVYYVHDYVVRVECPEDWTPPDRTAPRPGRVDDLRVVATGAGWVEIEWTANGAGGYVVYALFSDPPELIDEAGAPPGEDWAAGADTLAWQVSSGDAAAGHIFAYAVRQGTCAFPVAGSPAGEPIRCRVEGLEPDTAYQFVITAFNTLE